MRRRKAILLYVEPDLERSNLKMVLSTRGYAVVACDKMDDAIALLGSLKDNIDAILIVRVHNMDTAPSILEHITDLAERPPVMFVDHSVKMYPANVIIKAELTRCGDVSTAEILESLRILAQRKRGPKKVRGWNTMRAVQSAQNAAGKAIA